ncbi:MAG: hypothetical protein QOG34_1558, partial [Frankiaceae bacterium]|nr:hypothetical protein [Frankiaceae bacterium]
MRHQGPVLDLSNDEEVPITLLARPYDWRVRAVEQVEVVSAQACLRRRSLQVAPLRGVLELPDGVQATHASLVLPVGSWPKGPVTGFDVQVDECPAHMIPRVSIAEIQARYLAHLATEAGVTMPERVRRMLPILMGFTAGPWEQWLGEFDGDAAAALAPYLSDGLGAVVQDSDLREWRDLLAPVCSLLSPWLGAEGVDALDAVRNPLLSLPTLVEEGAIDPPYSNAFAEYTAFVGEAGDRAGKAEPNAADDLLIAMYEYGLYWDLMVWA